MDIDEELTGGYLPFVAKLVADFAMFFNPKDNIDAASGVVDIGDTIESGRWFKSGSIEIEAQAEGVVPLVTC